MIGIFGNANSGNLY